MTENKRNQQRAFLTSIIALLSSACVFVKIITEIGDNSSIGLVIYLFVSFCLVLVSFYSFIKEINFIIKNRKMVFKLTDREKINERLIEFITVGETDGSTVIFSKNLSWIENNPKILGFIEKKIRNDELLIFMQKENEISKRLESLGADIRYYGKILPNMHDEIIMSRFTIVKWGTGSTRLTYPKETLEYHHNFDYTIHEPTMDLAQDLVNVLSRLIPRTCA